MFARSAVVGLLALLVGCSSADFGSSDQKAQTNADTMGAVVHSGGVSFRVWAPNADAVHVRGDFDAWSDSGIAMTSDGNGNWSTDVPGAKAGQQYEYVLDSQGQRIHRADPRSRQVVDDNGTFKNSVIVDPNAYQWKTTSFTTPAFS